MASRGRWQKVKEAQDLLVKNPIGFHLAGVDQRSAGLKENRAWEMVGWFAADLID